MIATQHQLVPPDLILERRSNVIHRSNSTRYSDSTWRIVYRALPDEMQSGRVVLVGTSPFGWDDWNRPVLHKRFKVETGLAKQQIMAIIDFFKENMPSNTKEVEMEVHFVGDAGDFYRALAPDQKATDPFDQTLGQMGLPHWWFMRDPHDYSEFFFRRSASIPFGPRTRNGDGPMHLTD